jgi:hypothetical protein
VRWKPDLLPPQQFVAKWRNAALKESAAYQEHFTDLCRLLGQEPADDPRVEAIAATARELVVKRDAWLNPPGAAAAELGKRTLTALYNARPAWLDLAHRALDAAVLDAYGWPHDLCDEEILARLLALNRERAA